MILVERAGVKAKGRKSPRSKGLPEPQTGDKSPCYQRLAGRAAVSQLLLFYFSFQK